MKLNKIKVNGFGNLCNREIELKEGINIISGKNEAGKSTLLKFISSMFYGISKNKNGKELSDYEKYNPWTAEEFSGKVVYELDNKEVIEVFRDFNKKMPKVYNEKGEDITEKYGVNNYKQSLFFTEQTGITEDLLFKTAICEQDAVKLDKTSQNTVLQKIANMISTGNDNISYQKALTKLKERQNEEIGTDRTIGKPINVLKRDLKEVKEKLEKIKSCKEQNKNYEETKYALNNEIDKLNNEIKLFEEIQDLKEQLNLEQEKININKNSLYEVQENLNNVILEESKVEKKFIVKKDYNFLIAFIILLILSIIVGILSKNIFFTFGILLVSFIPLILHIKGVLKNQKIDSVKREEKIKVKKEKELLENAIAQKEKEINVLEDRLNEKILEETTKISAKNKVNVDVMEILKNSTENIKKTILIKQEKVSALKLELNTTEVIYKNVLQNLEELPELEERRDKLNIQEEELLSLNNSINLAKMVLEESYEQMKENITPKFINNLTEIIYKISNSKYSKVKFNDVDGLMVELENGEYVNANKLSVGTIDQMYLSLRLSSLKEIVQETVPIILDESFVFYDEERLENILNYLCTEYGDNQIIIFSCSNREKNILEKSGLKYNLLKI